MPRYPNTGSAAVREDAGVQPALLQTATTQHVPRNIRNSLRAFVGWHRRRLRSSVAILRALESRRSEQYRQFSFLGTGHHSRTHRMKKLLMASAAFALMTVPAMAQTSTTSPMIAAPTADRTVGAVGSERGNNANSLNGSNSAAGEPYSGANSMNNTDNGRTNGGGSGSSGGAGGGAGGAGGAGGGN